ncbi:MAG: hypothetical protein QG620_338 [Patescibacteria group bacterium]|nr:hypothetical protein [Patescibacteria group bacterium]
MLTLEDIIRCLRKLVGNKGSCFGVTDPSRLRQAFNECEGVVAKSEEPKGRTVRIDTDKMLKHLKGE